VTAPVAAPAPVAGGVGEPVSLPAWLLRQADERPKGVAIRVKELGRWREVTWADHLEQVERIGNALLQLGIAAGDRIAIVSDNRPEWITADLAAQGIGAATVGLLTTLPEPELGALLQRSGARVAFVEDEEQHDKVLAVRSGTKVERIVVMDTRGFRQIEQPAMSFEACETLGHDEAIAHRSGSATAWREAAAQRDADELATIVFTAGTTGLPKGVMLTHGALTAAAQAGIVGFDIRADDDQYSYLPLAEITERLLSVAVATCAGSTVHFGEGGESFMNDLGEVQPTVLLGPPRVWERMVAMVDAAERRNDWIKRKAIGFARRRGRRTIEARRGGQGSRSLIAEMLVARPLRRRLGLGRIRVALSGTAPANPAVLNDLWALGVPIRECYGVAETVGIATVQLPGVVQPGTVGRAVAGVDVRLGDGGVLMIHAAQMFTGYLDDAELTKGCLDKEGWFRTGDVAELDADGELRITGRADDALPTSTGTKVVPEPIEQRLVASQYIRDAVVIGSGRPHLAALLGIEAGAVREWASQREITANTYADLISRPEVRALIQEEVDAVNAGLAEHERITRFALLPAELSHDDGLLTATSKIRRGAVLDRFSSLVDGLYREEGGR
jgi:long-chain acyl-CoA synthetase